VELEVNSRRDQASERGCQYGHDSPAESSPPDVKTERNGRALDMQEELTKMEWMRTFRGELNLF